jgi:hypothetical protein
LTREQWLAYHGARAPKISRRQWAETPLLLAARNRQGDEKEEQRTAG